MISIHALREEGDGGQKPWIKQQCTFLSTPSARRATESQQPAFPGIHISIHALREEGDLRHQVDHLLQPTISIHALREEGDAISHAAPVWVRVISIHALREEGDLHWPCICLALCKFLSTPSARRATANFTKLGVVENLFLSTPSARRATTRASAFW